MIRQVRLHLPAIGGVGSQVVVDGTDVSAACSGLWVRSAVGEITQVELDLTRPVDVDGAAVVQLSDEAAALAVQLGWTPPAPVMLGAEQAESEG